MHDNIKDRISKWIVSVICKLDDYDKELVQEGMNIFSDIKAQGLEHCGVTPGFYRVKIGSDSVLMPFYIWDKINGFMIAQRDSQGAGSKIDAIKAIRQFVQDRYGYLPGLKEAKDAVENRENFPAK